VTTHEESVMQQAMDLRRDARWANRWVELYEDLTYRVGKVRARQIWTKACNLGKHGV
jgi:hypothetical protein